MSHSNKLRAFCGDPSSRISFGPLHFSANHADFVFKITECALNVCPCPYLSVMSENMPVLKRLIAQSVSHSHTKILSNEEPLSLHKTAIKRSPSSKAILTAC